MYYASVGRNCNLLIGIVVNNEGLVPEADAKRCHEFGNAIDKIFSNPIASTSGRGNTLELTLPASSSFDHVILQEDIQHGERTRQFTLEYFNNKKWTTFNTGSCIGHKRIVKVKPLTSEKIRLIIGESVAEPIIKYFAVYNSIEAQNGDDPVIALN